MTHNKQPTYKVTFKLSCLLLALGVSSTAGGMQAQDFAKFKARNQQQFETFKRDREADFEAFVKRWQEAETNYIKEVREKWDDGKISNRTQWVQYSDDNSQRTIIDYEANTVTVEFLDDAAKRTADSDAQAVQQALRQVGVLGTTSLASAVSNDPIHVSAGVNMSNVNSSIQLRGKPVIAPQYSQVQAKDAQVQRQANRTAVVIPLPTKAGTDRAEQMLPLAQKYAAESGLPVALVMAIIHTESSFNPLARSPIPAFGLMQIVPTSAGRDVTEFLTGEQQLLSADYLYDPEKNVHAGTTYLHLLGNRYFKHVRDPLTRSYLAIAAYNTGPGNVSMAMANTKSLSDATAVANRLNAQQVYDRLLANLPATETKNYLRKVTARQQFYQEEFNL